MNNQQQALASELARRSVARDAGFEESKHPRANNGQFGSGSSSRKPPKDVHEQSRQGVERATASGNKKAADHYEKAGAAFKKGNMSEGDRHLFKAMNAERDPVKTQAPSKPPLKGTEKDEHLLKILKRERKESTREGDTEELDYQIRKLQKKLGKS